MEQEDLKKKNYARRSSYMFTDNKFQQIRNQRIFNHTHS